MKEENIKSLIEERNRANVRTTNKQTDTIDDSGERG